MPKRDMPRGGRYTRPRRGFRAKSKYRQRHDVKHVRMESIDALRKRQGYIPGRKHGLGSEGRADLPVWSSDADLQMPTMPEMAPDYLEELSE